MKIRITALFSILVVLAAVFAAGAQNDKKIVDDPKELYGSVQLFADSISLISTDYVESVDVKDLVHGAIEGMMKTLDDYSQFLDQESFKKITEDTKGEFGGIGIEVGIRDGVLTVIAPMEDTPAERAGMEKGDKIIMIDGELTRGLKLDDAVKKLKGNAGTRVVLTVYRKSEEDLLKFRITRAIIKLKSIKDVEVISDGIGYINLVEFQERTARDLRETINDLMKKDVRGIILDLRNNPGGLLNASIDVADLFLPQGALIVYTEGRDPSKRMEFRSKKMSDLDEIDLAILVNRGSASASEILAGAIKDKPGRGLEFFRDNVFGAVARVVAEGQGALVDLRVVGDEHARLAGYQGLLAHERHGADVADGAELSPAACSPVGVRHVFDDLDSPPLGQVHDRGHVGGVAAVVNDDDGARPVGHTAFDVGRIDAERVRIRLGEDHRGAEGKAGQRRGPVGQAGTDDLIAFSDAAGPHGRQERSGSVVARQGVFRSLPGGEFLLEGARHIEARHGAGPQDFQHGRLVLRSDLRPGGRLVERRGRSLRPAEDRQCLVVHVSCNSFVLSAVESVPSPSTKSNPDRFSRGMGDPLGEGTMSICSPSIIGPAPGGVRNDHLLPEFGLSEAADGSADFSHARE